MTEDSMRHGGNVWEGGHPERWLDFSANLRAGGMPEWAYNVIKDALGDIAYYPDRAMKAAREGLAAYAGVAETNILPTAGGIAAIDLALSLKKGAVLLLPPTFGGYEERARVRGRAVKTFCGRCAPDDTVVVCNPNNPTGQIRGFREIMALYRQVKEQGGTLLVDEAFIDYCPEHSVRAEASDSLMVAGSLTKTLGIPGVRLGYLCADEQRIRALSQMALPWSISALASRVAAALPAHLEEIRGDAALNAQRRERLTKALTELGASVAPSGANFLLVDFGRDMTAAASLLKQKNILVRTCASFGLAPKILRLAVKTEPENERLIAALREVLLCAENH